MKTRIKTKLLLTGLFCAMSSAQAATIVNTTNWNMDSNGISGDSEPFDRFGEAVSHGDFNGDGYDDLAVGIPNHDFLGLVDNTGTVLIMYGTASGLSANNEQFLFQKFDDGGMDLETVNGLEENEFFGTTLASGDFNCDGYDDLAVGTPNEQVILGGQDLDNVGAINIFYGSDTGFPVGGQGSTFIWQGSGQGAFFSDFIEDGDYFGWSMAVGNFNGDFDEDRSCDDLAVSAPFEDFGIMDTTSNGGVVDVFYGDPMDGLTGENRDRLSQNTASAEGDTESNDRFGLSLAAGSFRDDSIYSDLAVGIPGEDVDGENSAGAVQVFYGSAGGPSTSNDEIWSQSGSIAGAVEAGDQFGSSLTTGNFNGDLATDLAIGVTKEHIDVDGISDAGAVNVIYGSVGGLTTTGNQIFHQNSPSQSSLTGLAENADQFGDTMVAGDVTYDQYDDLVVGVPRENGLNGAFHVISGGPGGLTLSGNSYHAVSAGGVDDNELARSLTIGDFGNGPELVAGMPGEESEDTETQAGSVQVFEFLNPDVIFADSFDD